MTPHRIRFIILVALCLGAAVALTMFLDQNPSPEIDSAPITNESEESVAVNRLTGVVESVSENSIVVRVLSPATIETTRVVMIDETTSISEISVRDRSAVEKEMASFEAEMKAFQAMTDEEKRKNPAPQPPISFERNSVEFDALRVGQTVNVSADIDMVTAETFSAQSIEIIPQSN